ncbi:MAG: amidohydrolase family protein [Chloroflexi bacterium]|nr:amidohydrolase family protein [Chloroflexota bacterium]
MSVVDTQIHFRPADSPDRPADPTVHTGLGDEPFGPERFLPMMDGCGVDRAVIVPPGFSPANNDYALECVAAHPGRFGVMGLVDPTAEETPGLIARWRSEPGMLGVRGSVTELGRARWSSDEAAERFWAASAEHRVPVAVMAADALDYVDELLARHPSLPLSVDHLGLPRIGAEWSDAWYRQIEALARRPRLVLRLSTLPARSREPFPFADTHPLARHAYETFGPERLLWGTDHTQTLGRRRATYCEELRLVSEGLDFLSAGEREAILGGNALRYLEWPGG